METIKSFLLILRDSQGLLSSNRNNSHNFSDEVLLSFLQRIIVDSVETQEKLNMIFKHHLSLSQKKWLVSVLHGIIRKFS